MPSRQPYYDLLVNSQEFLDMCTEECLLLMFLNVTSNDAGFVKHDRKFWGVFLDNKVCIDSALKKLMDRGLVHETVLNRFWIPAVAAYYGAGDGGKKGTQVMNQLISAGVWDLYKDIFPNAV